MDKTFLSRTYRTAPVSYMISKCVRMESIKNQDSTFCLEDLEEHKNIDDYEKIQPSNISIQFIKQTFKNGKKVDFNHLCGPLIVLRECHWRALSYHSPPPRSGCPYG